MANFKFIVKKGAGAPVSGTLVTGELGYNTSLKKLYIGNTSAVASPVSMEGLVHISALGTASLPGYTFTGDLNTGIFSAGADLLGLVTNGVERLRVTATGSVGIGTTSPAERLEVSGNVRTSGQYQYGANAYTAYNSTDQSIDFIFN
jgi:hypothetical protein